ncbi:MAG TPA: hypothetical protein VGC63_10860 [Solirubrobacterales bacterium]
MTNDLDQRFEPLDEFETFVESRRQAIDAMIWQVPALSVAAQAFLYVAGLNPRASDGIQIFAGAIGFMAAIAAMQLLLKHRYHEESYAQTIDASRRARGMTPFRGLSWFKEAAMRDSELKRKEDGKRSGYERRWRSGSWRRKLTGPSSVGVWTLTLFVFAAGDVLIVAGGILHGVGIWQPFR